MNNYEFVYNHLDITKKEVCSLSQQHCAIIAQWLQGKITMNGEYKSFARKQCLSPLKILLTLANSQPSIQKIHVPCNTYCRELREEKHLDIFTQYPGYVIGDCGKRIQRFEQIVQPLFTSIHIFEIR